MLHVKSILWPSDDSESSVRALETAVELAKQFGAKIYGLQAVPQVPVYTDTAVPMTGFDIPRYEGELKKSTHKALKQKIAAKVSDDVEVETFVEIGKPSDVIINFAKERKVDLIVMATHSRPGISHFFIGSVTEDTMRRSTIPILVVPEAGSR